MSSMIVHPEVTYLNIISQLTYETRNDAWGHVMSHPVTALVTYSSYLTNDITETLIITYIETSKNKLTQSQYVISIGLLL